MHIIWNDELTYSAMGKVRFLFTLFAECSLKNGIHCIEVLQHRTDTSDFSMRTQSCALMSGTNSELQFLAHVPSLKNELKTVMVGGDCRLCYLPHELINF